MLPFLLISGLGLFPQPVPSGYDPPVPARLTIVYPDGQRVALSDEDLLWTARMVVGEGGAHDEREASAIIWTLVQRRFWGTGMPRPNPSAFAGYQSWATYIQSFSQPINPVWRDPRSPQCRANPQQCTPAIIAAREYKSRLSWDDVPEPVQAAVMRFADGQLENPVPGVVDFRAKDQTAAHIIATDPARDASDVAGHLENFYLYSRSGTSKAWAGNGITFEAGLDPVTSTLAALVPGARELITRGLARHV